MLAASYPAAVGAYLEPVGRIIDLVFGALAQAIPDKVPAAFFGTVGVLTISGTHPRTNAYFVGVFPYPGGYGASRDSDGLVNGNPTAIHGELHVAGALRAPVSDPLREVRAARRFRRRRLAPWRLRDHVHDLRELGLHRLGARRPRTVVAVRASWAGHAAPSEVEFTTEGSSWTPEFGGKQEKQLLRKGD
jgi:N-methylhydantoinase B